MPQNQVRTTPEEKTFLSQNISQFEAAQEGKKTQKWLLAFYLRWFQKFPDYSNGRIDVDNETVKKVSVHRL